MSGGLDIQVPIVSLQIVLNNTVLVPVRCTVHGLVELTASSTKGVCLVMAFAEAGGSFRHFGQGSLPKRSTVSECSCMIAAYFMNMSYSPRGFEMASVAIK